MIKMKTCKKCGIEKELNQFQKHKSTKDGHRNFCRDCRKFNFDYSKVDLTQKKKCSKCHETKDIIDFVKNKSSVNGFRNYCKLCANMEKAYLEKNKKEKDPIAYRSLRKQYKNNYRSKEENRKKERRKDKERRKTIEYKERRKTIYKKRVGSDNLYKLKLNVKSSIRSALKNKGFDKNKNTIDILGCSYEDFYNYITEQFESWMSWENYGIYTGNYNETWQIDHIIPISSANNEEEIIKLNHYTNLRPLCSKKNLEKSNLFSL